MSSPRMTIDLAVRGGPEEQRRTNRIRIWGAIVIAGEQFRNSLRGLLYLSAGSAYALPFFDPLAGELVAPTRLGCVATPPGRSHRRRAACRPRRCWRRGRDGR